ncbi:penicillin-binding protein [Cellulomonas chitinilytica]|nr:transglycosylase domain-containing protein [Cellulomonas chitinilytica]
MPNPARSRGRQVNAFQALALLLSFVLVAGVGGVLAAGLTLPGVAAANGVTDLSITAFDGLPTELGTTTLPEKSTILAADGSLLATFYDQNRVVVPLTEISPLLQHAVIATEDRRFYEHAGVDPQGMARAFVKNLAGQDQEGASTLTQQYVKNVLIEKALSTGTKAEQLAAVEAAKEHEGTEGYARKLREAKLAIALEKTMTKDQILEKYLNIAQFGASVYGAESAAQYYFGKPAKDINYLEAATIAGITQSPTKWDPTINPGDSETRRNRVLLNMKKQGYITAEEYTAGVTTPLPATLNVHPLRQGCMTAGDVVAGAGYFCDYVTKVIVNDPAFGPTPDDRKAVLYRGGLIITTTLDPRLQTIADAEVKASIPVDDTSGVADALVTVQPGTGKILAMAQNRNYTPVAANPGDEPINYNTDFQYGASQGFSPGSTFKPFTLLEWLKEGHSLYETIDATPLQYPMNAFHGSCTKLSGGTYKFHNSSGGETHPMTVLDATRNSVNSAYIAMGTKLDLCAIMQGATDLGVHTPGSRTVAPEPYKPYPANIIGSDTVAPLTMAAAYATFASGGVYCAPIAITSVKDPAGTELPVPQAGCHQAIDPKYANAINFALSGIWDGTARGVGEPPFPSAGKTGTTSENEYTWFAGYTPLLATVSWIGFSAKPTPVQDVIIKGKFYPRLFGATFAAPLWKAFMVQALDGAPNPAFAAPDDKQVFGEKKFVPNVVGKSVGDATAALKGAGFSVSVDPNPVASTVPAGSVAEQSPTGSTTPGSVVTLRLSNGQPPAGPGLPGFPGNGNGGGNGGH